MKINLLPARVHDKGKLRAVWAIVAILLLAELLGLSLFQSSLLARERKLEQDVQEAKVRADAVNAIEQETRAENAKIAGIDQKVTFVKNLTEYNEQRPNLYQRTAEYTLEGIRYTSMSASQNLLQVQGWAPTLSDAGRYLLYMQNSPDFSQVRISGVPGYPPGGQTGGGAAGLGDVGLPGGPGAFPGGPGGFAPEPGDVGGLPPGGPPPGAFGPGPGGPEAFGPGGPGGFAGGGGGGGRSITGGAFQNARARNVPPRPPQGFGFSVNAVLIKPVTRPIFGGQQQQPGFGGYGMDPYGMGPGMPGAFGPEAGMPPGMPGPGMPPGMPGPGMPPGAPGPAGPPAPAPGPAGDLAEGG